MEETWSHTSVPLMTLETQVGEQAHAMNDMYSSTLPSEDDDIWKCNIETFTFDEEFPGPAMTKKKDLSVILWKNPY